EEPTQIPLGPSRRVHPVAWQANKEAQAATASLERSITGIQKSNEREKTMKSSRIYADNETLLRQAPMTAHAYLLHAEKDIDEILGSGYAKKHPELIAAYINVCAVDLGTAVIARAIETLPSSIETGRRHCCREHGGSRRRGLAQILREVEAEKRLTRTEKREP